MRLETARRLFLLRLLGDEDCVEASLSFGVKKVLHSQYPTQNGNYLVRFLCKLNYLPFMARKPTQKIFRLNTIIEGRLITGRVSFSPAPQPGVLTEVARLEAELLLEQTVREAISSGEV